MSHNINFTNEIQEWLQINREQQQHVDSSDSFQTIWNQLGNVVKSNCCNYQQQPVVMSSFFALTLRDFLKILPDAVPDESNFWSSMLFPNYKFTTYSAIQGEEGFYKLALTSTMTYVVFESDSHQQPCVIESNQSKLFIFPYIQSPYVILFFLTLINGKNNSLTSTTTSITTTTSNEYYTYQESNNILTNVNGSNNVNVENLLKQWKKEKPNLKPTIPKLADYFTIEQDKIHKWLKTNGKSWSNMLVTYGFR